MTALHDVLPDLGPLQAHPLYERVAGEIADQIRTRVLRPGDRLPSERTMAQQLEVGRSTVREALASLQLDGVIETRHGAGSIVTESAPELVRERLGREDPPGVDVSPSALLDVRELIEPAAARWAAERAQRDELAESLLEPQQGPGGVEDIASRSVWNDRDRLFHRQIGVMTGNPILTSFCTEIAETMDQLLWQHLRDSVLTDARRVRLFEAEHTMIYEAIVSGFADAAEFHSREHIKRVRRYMALD